MCQPGWERGLGDNRDMFMYSWVPSLFIWNYHNIVDWLYPNTKLKFKIKTYTQWFASRFTQLQDAFCHISEPCGKSYFYLFWWRMQNSVCAQLCPTLCDPMDCCPPGPSVHGILQARILDWISISSSRGPSWPSDWTHISCSPALQVDSLPKFEPPGNPKHPPSPWVAPIKPQGYTKSLWEGYDPWTGWPSAAHLASLRFFESQVLRYWLCIDAQAQNVWCEWQAALPLLFFLRAAGSHMACSPHQTTVAQITSSLSAHLARAGPSQRTIPE